MNHHGKTNKSETIIKNQAEDEDMTGTMCCVKAGDPLGLFIQYKSYLLPAGISIGGL